MVWFKLLAVGGASQADGDHNRDHVVKKTYFVKSSQVYFVKALG
jgi:hypothetical protein